MIDCGKPPCGCKFHRKEARDRELEASYDWWEAQR